MATSRRRRAWLPSTLLQNMRSSSAGQQPVGAQPGAGARRDHRARVRCSDRAAGGSTVIDCQGRTLTPGLIDNPWQTMLAAPPPIAGAVHVSPLAGSPDEARLCTRQQLLPGASQIKVEAGGGVASAQATGNWGTWVGVHACRPQAIHCAFRHCAGGPAASGR
jgi:hypothetical protein